MARRRARLNTSTVLELPTRGAAQPAFIPDFTA